MIGEEHGLQVGTLISIAKCKMQYRMGEEDVTAVFQGEHGALVEMTFTREGLETFAPLVLTALPALVATLDADDAADIADLEARGLRKKTPTQQG
ncbi:MAG: hypothetical protein M3443_06655 [Actinomycetota bacterium]|nr:hypothetical protein [Actinomycetota bacterium]